MVQRHPRHLDRCAAVGGVAVEKNIEAFLRLDLPGSKLVIGDGPALAGLRDRYPDACFVGLQTGRDLARHLAGRVVVDVVRTGTPRRRGIGRLRHAPADRSPGGRRGAARRPTTERRAAGPRCREAAGR